MVLAVFVVGYTYFYGAIGTEKMREIFKDYMQENIENYQDFEEVMFGLYEGTTTPGERGYAGVGQYYEIEYAHKKYDWVRFYISTDGYELVSNYENALKILDYMDIATEYFHENVNEQNIVLTTVYCSPWILESEDYDKFIKKPATKESVLDYIQIFEPKITLNGADFNYKNLIDLDNRISQVFPRGSSYEINFKDRTISCSSEILQEYNNYDELENR